MDNLFPSNPKDITEARQALQRLRKGMSSGDLVMTLQSLLQHTNAIPDGGINGSHLSADALTRIRSFLAGSIAASSSSSSAVAWNSDQNILANQIFGS